MYNQFPNLFLFKEGVMDWKVFGATFTALFIAELGDKTQLAAISMTGKTGKPVAVFLGAVLAMALVTLIGVVFGEALTRVIPVEYLEKGAAGLFVLIGVLMWFEVL
jgi:putative Ca2+/H+ antiporter (TMEM165/GDT1 family)